MKPSLRGILTLLLSLLVLLSAGTVGFMVLEGYSAVDALFMTVITLSTVGFETLRPLHLPGKLFTIVLIVVGVATFSFHLTKLVTLVVERGFLAALERRRMEKKIHKLSGHTVICGHGRIGSVVADEFLEEGKEIVVLERRPEEVDKLQRRGIVALIGDAREDESLRQAGVLTASGLITLLPDDADNLYVILSAKDMNPDLLVVARANRPDGEKRLLKAGATKVISPHREGGKRIARMVLNPNITDYIEMATGKENLQLQMAEFTVNAESPLAGKTLMDTDLLKKHRTLVVAIKRAEGSMTFNPEGSTRIHAGDALIVIGPAVLNEVT